MNLIPYVYPYDYIPPAARDFLPPRSVCSIAPAQDSADNLFTGNGSHRLDAAGRPYDEEFIVTQERLYQPQWAETPQPPDLRPYMGEIRRHVLAGEPEKADLLLDKALRDAGFDQRMDMDAQIVYPVGSLRQHTGFRLRVRQPEAGRTRDYLRWLDMESGALLARWGNDRGAFTSQALAAYEGDLIAIRLTAPTGGLDAALSLHLPDQNGPFGRPELTGAAHRLYRSPSGLRFEVAYDPRFGQKGYVGLVRFVPVGGEAALTEDGFQLQGGDSLTVYARVYRVEENFAFGCGEAAAARFFAAALDYDKLVESNRVRLGGRMARSALRLGDPADAVLSGEELLRRCHSRSLLDPTLLSKLYDLGRFYQIIDTGELPPMWGQHNINTNLQVCAGNNTGLFEEMDVYFRYYEAKFADFRTNARLLYGARGMLASVHCDYDSGLFYHFSRTYPHYAWTGCLGWIYNEFWGYYLVTGDLDFLRNRVVPALKEIALFFEDYACQRDAGGKVIFVPSFSPENPTPNPGYETVTSRSINPTRVNSVMDIAICREVLENLMTACSTLGVEAESLPRWQAQLDSLPDLLLDEEGGLKEWAWPSIEENYNHRHVSHHYDVWPGRAVTPDTQPALAEAIRISNRKRGQQDDSAHGLIHRTLTAVRLRDREEAEQNLGQLVGHGFVRRTLSTAHFPYRGWFPDLQGAMPAILLEMCVFSAPGVVELLPALPAALPAGELEGVWLYTWAKLERLRWDERGLRAVLVSRRDQTLRLICRRGGVISVGGTRYPAGNAASHAFAAGERAEITVEF